MGIWIHHRSYYLRYIRYIDLYRSTLDISYWLRIAAIDHDFDCWSFKSYEKCRQKSENEIKNYLAT